MEVEELGLLLKGHRLHGNRSTAISNRSGSAPPSVEGSYAAIKNLLAEHDAENLSSVLEKYNSEEQLRADPAYVSYYVANVNLNPRLPPPLISQENRRLVHHIGGFGDNWKSTSPENVGKRSSHLSHGALSTHKEEAEDERSPKQGLDSLDELKSALMENSMGTSIGRHKSLVDLIQEDFPRTPSPVYSLLRPSSCHQTAEESVDPTALPSSEDVFEVLESHLGSVNLHDHPLPTTLKDSSSIKITLPGDVSSVNSTTRSDISRMDPVLIKNQEEQQPYTRTMPPQFAQQGIPNIAQYMMDRVVSHNHPNSSFAEVQPPYHTPGLIPPLYPTTAAYMTSVNPFYSNFQPSGLYPSQYGFSGYPIGSSALPPQYIPGYPSHNAVSIPFDLSSSMTGKNIFDGSGKFYGQPQAQHPPYMDHVQMPYFHHPFGSPIRSPTAMGGQAYSFIDNELHSPGNGSLSLHNVPDVGISGSGYYGFPLRSVQAGFTESPLTGLGQPFTNERRFLHGSNRHVGLQSPGQGQKGVNQGGDLKKLSFLEEFKSANSRKFELSDIAGRIVEFSVDQHGSRFIQQKLENCSHEEKEAVFKEIFPHASVLFTDVFGNYVIQKFFEHGSPEQRKELADQFVGQLLMLSLQMYGCRVVQKALEVIELDQKTQIVQELDGYVMKCVYDQNGNHVIQKCVECVPTETIGFILSAFSGQVAMLSSHPYGCRVIQRVLEHCSDERTQFIVDEILASAYSLAQDQYGNYVTQHVLERGKPHERSQIIEKLSGKIVEMSQHKYASNVVEKCLEHADVSEKELLIEEIIGKPNENDHLLTMMKDQFANYVVQKVLEISKGNQREILLDRIKFNLQALKTYTFGKHIVARFEQLFSEERQDQDCEEGA